MGIEVILSLLGGLALFMYGMQMMSTNLEAVAGNLSLIHIYLPYVKSVTSMSNTLPEGIPEEFLPYSVTSELHTKDYCRMLIYIRTKTESDQAFKGADEIRDILERDVYKRQV